MKCLNCAQENKETAKHCKKCGSDMTLPPAWFPDWKWHAKCLGGIWLGLSILFLLAHLILHRLPPPYHQRQIPPEMTPWLHPEKANIP